MRVISFQQCDDGFCAATILSLKYMHPTYKYGTAGNMKKLMINDKNSLSL